MSFPNSTTVLALSSVGGGGVSVVSLTVLGLMLAIAVYGEVKERKIPNWLTFSGMSLGLLLSAIQGMDAFGSSLLGLALGFGLLFVFYVFGGFGGGDVKLMGAAGALLGFHLVTVALIYTALLGAVMAVLMLIWRKDAWTRICLRLRQFAPWKQNGVAKVTALDPIEVPYGIPIALGCLLALMVEGR
jgi:prepilin peptidase CpaA